MADPLHNNEFPELDTRTTRPVGTGLQENRGSAVAYQAPLEDPILKGELNPDRQLTDGDAPLLNRTAEQIGSALGKTVSQARRVPAAARRGLYVVRDRANEAGASAAQQLSGPASTFADTAQQRARDLADTMKTRAGEFMDVAEERGRVLLDKADDLSEQVAQRANELKRQLDDRTRELREHARQQATQARLKGARLIEERPLQVLGGIAAAAFLLGVSLRIVRSRNASRY